MDEKAIMGFVLWMFFCVGLLTFYTVPERTGLACLGNVIGLVALVGALRLPRVRQWLSEPNLMSLILLLVLFALGLIFSLGLGQLAQIW